MARQGPPLNSAQRNNIRLSVKRLGRPPKNPVINETHKQQLSANQRWRNEVEGVCGSGKRKDSLRLIMARLAKGAETSISMVFLMMCTEKIRRLLRLFYVFISACFPHGNGPILMDGAYAHLAACNKRTTDHRIVKLNGCLTPGPWLKSNCLAGCFIQQSLHQSPIIHL